MTLERPAALALLLVVPVLLLLRLRAARPRTGRASSLLVWRRVAGDSPDPRQRPRPPLSAWLEAAAAGLAALAVAEPSLLLADAPRPVVILDTSPSMQVRDGPGGSTREEAARAAVRRAGLEASDVRPARDPAAGVAAAVGAEAAGRPLVLLTDRRPRGGPAGVAVAGWGGPAVNGGIVAAAADPLPGGGAVVVVTVALHGAAGPTPARLQVGAGTSDLLLRGSGETTVERRVADVGPTGIGVRLELPGDALAADDEVLLRPRGGGPVALRCDDAFAASPLGRALLAAGPARGSGAAGEDPVLAVPGGDAPPVILRIPAAPDGGPVAGATVVTTDHPLAAEVLVDPSADLGRRGRGGAPGAPVLADGEGPLVGAEAAGDGLRVSFAFQPGGSWAARDPSFVVLATNLVEAAGGGPARFAAEGLLDPAETDAAGEGFGDADTLLRARGRGGSGRRGLGLPLLAAATLLAIASLLLHRRGR